MYGFRYAVYCWFRLIFIDKDIHQDYEGALNLEKATTQDVLYSYLNFPYIYQIALFPALELWYRSVTGSGGLPQTDRYRFFRSLEPQKRLINFRL